MDQETLNENPNVNIENETIEINDDTDSIEVWNHYSGHLDANENDFYPSLMRDVGQDVPTSCPDEIFRQPNKSKNVTTKPKISGAFGATKDDPYSVSRCMSVINGMVDGALITDDSPLLYLIMDLFEDAVKRELFMNYDYVK
ncbi:hypothetical protein Tco_1147412 [Tanacetum coccineum]